MTHRTFLRIGTLLAIGLSGVSGRPPTALSAQPQQRADSPAATGHTVTRLADGRSLVVGRSEEHTSELQSHLNLVCRLLLEKKKTTCDQQRLEQGCTIA